MAYLGYLAQENPLFIAQDLICSEVLNYPSPNVTIFECHSPIFLGEHLPTRWFPLRLCPRCHAVDT